MSAMPAAGQQEGPADAFSRAEPDDLALRAGQRIEAILGQFSEIPDRRAQLWAEDLVRAVSDLYGAALARVVAVTGRCTGGQGSCLEQLAVDELVANVLVLHDLHPRDLVERVTAAVAEVMAQLSSADAKVLAFDPQTATLRLRLLVEPGAAASAGAIERQLRRAVQGAAPEVETVEIDRPPAPTPVTLVTRR